MAGWIRKLSTGRYQARYRAPDGRTRAKTWDRRVDAERWLRSELAKVDRGRWLDPDAGKTTLDTYGHLFEGLDEAAAQRLDDLALERIAHETRTEGGGRVFHLDT